MQCQVKLVKVLIAAPTRRPGSYTCSIPGAQPKFAAQATAATYDACIVLSCTEGMSKNRLFRFLLCYFRGVH